MKQTRTCWIGNKFPFEYGWWTVVRAATTERQRWWRRLSPLPTSSLSTFWSPYYSTSGRGAYCVQAQLENFFVLLYIICSIHMVLLVSPFNFLERGKSFQYQIRYRASHEPIIFFLAFFRKCF